jgi:hypothetical protein
MATLLLSQGVPMILGRRRDRPHAAGQQQRVLPGQRALVVRLGTRRRRPARASPDDVLFVVPGDHAGTWTVAIDTAADPGATGDPVTVEQVEGERAVPGRSMLVMLRSRDQIVQIDEASS